MAISTETIRRITITADGSPSVDAVSESLDKLTKSQDKATQAAKPLAEFTDAVAKKQVSAAEAYRRQTLAVDDNARMQDRVAKATAVATAAFNQGILGDVNSAEAKAALARRIDEIAKKYGQATVAVENYNKIQNTSINSAQAINAKLGIGAGGAAVDRGADVAAYGNELDRLRAKYNPLFAAQQQYRATLTEINIANKVGAITAVERVAAIQKTKDAFAQEVVALKSTSAASTEAGGVAKALSAAMSGVSGQLIALSASAGPAGVFLAALGPWGVAAAVGIGAAEKALSMMSDAAHGLAIKSGELQKFSELTGLTTAQVQALRSEASRFGVSSDDAQHAIARFMAQFNELRVGEGDLLTQIRRVNPALADQMAATNNAGVALTLFGQALEKVDNVFQRNALVQAASGHKSLSAAAFLSGLNVDKVTQSYVEAGKALDDNLIKKLAQLEIDIAKTSAKAKEVWASIFSEETLRIQLASTKGWLEFSESVRLFTISGDLDRLLTMRDKFWDWFRGGQATSISNLGNFAALEKQRADIEAGIERAQKDVNTPGVAGNNTRAAMDLLQKQLDKIEARIAIVKQSLPSGVSGVDEAGFAGLGVPAVPLPIGRPQAIDPRYLANQLKDQVSAMGEAAGAAMRLDLAQKQLTISGKDAGLSAGQMAAAHRVLNETFAATALNARIGLLGLMATSTEINTQSQFKLNAANRQGANIYGEQARLIKEADVLKADAAKQNAVAQFGLVSQTEMLNQKNAEYLNLARQLNLSNEQVAAGYGVVARNVRVAWEASQVAASAFPSLRQATFDAQNLNKQLDQLATQELDALASGFANAMTSTDKFSVSLTKMGLNALNIFNQMIMKMIIMQSLGPLFQGGGISLLSLIGLGGNNADMGGSGIGSGGFNFIDAQAGSRGGMVGMLGETRYVHPAYFENAPHFNRGGMITDDGVPIIAHPGERILNRSETAAYNRGGSGNSVKMDIVFKIDGAVGKEEIAGMIKQGMAKATQQAISISSAAAPARQDRFNKLGT